MTEVRMMEVRRGVVVETCRVRGSGKRVDFTPADGEGGEGFRVFVAGLRRDGIRDAGKPRSPRLYPKDGEAFVEALPRAFFGSYFWAEVVGA